MYMPVDMDNHRIQKFTSSGTFITKWGFYGTGDGEFNSPSGIAVGASGNVYVADYYNNRIQVFGYDTPALTSLTPSSGAVGSTVTITGTSFGAAQGSSELAFRRGTRSPRSRRGPTRRFFSPFLPVLPQAP